MVNDVKAAKRVVSVPGGTSFMGSGELLSVEVGPDEDVEWFWCHDRERGSFVAGYAIVPALRAPPP